MKRRSVQILLVAAALGAGAVLLVLRDTSPASNGNSSDDPVEAKPIKHSPLKLKAETKPEPAPQPVPPAPVKRPPAKVATRTAAKPPPDPEEARRTALRRYWEHQARQFDRQNAQLMREENPTRRKNLIKAMSRYVRVDTMSAIDWAMNMADPEERKAALEAINKNALSGIGARIEVDETGIPLIRETTVLSAAAATGRVEAGDYIVGMEDGSGQSIYFEGLSAPQVAQHLRGKPGTEVRLLMERAQGHGTSQPYEVTLQRSLLVVQPPY